MLYTNNTGMQRVYVNNTEMVRVFANNTLVFHRSYDIINCVQFTGSQYVDIGFTPNANSQITMTATITSSSGFTGVDQAASGGGCLIGVYNNNQIHAAYTSSSSNLIYLGPTNTYATYYIANGKQATNGETKGTNQWSMSSTPGRFLIGALNQNYSGDYSVRDYISMYLYRFKVVENGSTKYDIYPAKRKSDGVVGLYNQIDDQFYAPSRTLNGIYE